MIFCLLLLFLPYFSSSNGGAGGGRQFLLLNSLANKHFIDQLPAGSYEIVHPFQMRENSRERMSIDTREHLLNMTPAAHFRQANFVIRSSVLVHQRLRLALNLNENLLSERGRLREAKKNPNKMMMDKKEEEEKELSQIENCYYQGSVNSEPGSVVALSTCTGLWGLIAFTNGTAFGIWPLEGGNGPRRHPHVLYRLNKFQRAKCASLDKEGEEENNHQLKKQKRKRHIVRRKKRREDGGIQQQQQRRRRPLFMELAMVVDLQMMNQHFDFTRSKGLEYSLNALNLAGFLFHRDLNLRLSANFIEIFSNSKITATSADDREMMLSKILDYSTGHLYGRQKDATILLTSSSATSSNSSKGNNNGTDNGRSNSAAAVASATVHQMAAISDSVCTNRAVAFVQVPSPIHPYQSALDIVHSIGHMLGIGHDDSPTQMECGCFGGQHHCLMSAFNPIGGVFPLNFSACSLARFVAQLDHPSSSSSSSSQSHHFHCLFAHSSHPAARLFHCGNGVVDEGEECDCGTRDKCQDPCCDPRSCQLRPHAKCASHHSCCHRCQFRPSGHPCRPARSVCDISESCDGANGDCPNDGHLLDGTQCGLGGMGQCWQGECADGDAQCRQIWGQGARLAESLCFGQNGRALEYGNCGRDMDGRFVECAVMNERCGLLHCQDGGASPIISSTNSSTSFALQFGHVQCKVLTNSTLAYVQDGTKCGDGRVCIHSVCLPLSQVSPFVQCPSNNLSLQCSGHGDCTNIGQCLCFDGWNGLACEHRRRNGLTGDGPHSGNGIRSHSNHHHLNDLPQLISMSPSGGTRFNGRALETATLLAILLFVGLLLLLLLICMLFFYRRKTSADSFGQRIGGIGQMKVADEEEGEETTEGGGGGGRNGTIKFGQMPSWREEKRKKKTNKRVYDALQRITEAANEADSLSLTDSLSLRRKSRESSAVAVHSSIALNGVGGIVANCAADGPIVDAISANANWRPNLPLSSPSPLQNGLNVHPTKPSKSSAFFTKNCGQGGGEETDNEAREEENGDGQEERMPPPPFGPRLANISMLMRKLDSTNGLMGTMENGGGHGHHPQFLMSRQPSLPFMGQQPQPPASTDSGNPGSNLDIRESPSLFSDPYRLDVPNC